jgi:hypothetical protein
MLNQILKKTLFKGLVVLVLLTLANAAWADDGFNFADLGAGGFAGGGQYWRQSRTETDTKHEQGAATEAGGRLCVDFMWLCPTKHYITFLWELRAALLLLGGYQFQEASAGYGGFELKGGGDVGMSMAFFLPVNQAIEDVKIRVTNKGVEGKVLIGTTHVLPLVDQSKAKGYYLSLTHGFRYHSALGGWTWALLPRVRLVDLKYARLDAKYLYGFWFKGRREHSGSLSLHIPLHEHMLMGVSGEAEYLEKSRNRGDSLIWRAMLNLSWFVCKT